MESTVDIAIADDNAGLLLQMKENLSDAENINVLFTAANGQDLLDKLLTAQKLPQVILMDIEMPLMNGIEATANVTQNTDIKVLILTVFDNDEKIFDAIKAGAAGYLLKDSKPYRIINAIEDIMQGGGPMSPQIAAKALALLREKTTDSKKPQPADYNLSDRETQLLQSLVEGLSYQQIADKLFISHGTVRKHIENIYSKLHIHTKVEAVQTANKHKWFS
ncbi:MAG: response regulator transcription factor [Chitinophagaceae bacterium]|nr:response regulator transcription factor [Chitinophagaceae bacterium]